MGKNKDLGILIIRLLIGVLMLLHGIHKLNGVSFIEGALSVKGLPGFFAYGVYIGEIIAPIMLIVGFRVRIAAIIFAFNCIVAMLLAHFDDIFSLNKYGGWATELLGLYLFGAVSLIFSGGGKIAVSSKNAWD